MAKGTAVPTKKHDVQSDRHDTKLTKGMRDGGSYAEAAWDKEKTAPEGDLGFSEYEVGNQDNAEAPAAAEGARAIEAQIENGGVSSHERFSDLMKATPTGFEK
jgi:hypothetical protein